MEERQSVIAGTEKGKGGTSSAVDERLAGGDPGEVPDRGPGDDPGGNTGPQLLSPDCPQTVLRYLEDVWAARR
ncbi:hypothetical protein NDU88_009406 [Pleurodeles waltl]|uniref:Uncharacterized protein n=1 Tax=Pleurodeles waltl TaxID=8319 RepID=A0AAV7QV70_PLEWA|nr:hypothetical protein NDU88_009406 [Pleurodeles waltl]